MEKEIIKKMEEILYDFLNEFQIKIKTLKSIVFIEYFVNLTDKCVNTNSYCYFYRVFRD